MTTSELYRELKNASARGSAAFDISQLLDMHLGKNARIMLAQQQLSNETEAAIRADAYRLEQGYPLQYILGEWEFFGLPFKVGEGVLIPRADTEISVEKALELLKDVAKPQIADLCAGSGAIAVAMAKNLPCCKVFAVELYDEAFKYLSHNIALNNVQQKVNAVRGDVMDLSGLLPDGLDMIISNPPYITADEMLQLDDQVRCEPQTALAGGADGLDFYRAIAHQAISMIKSGGWLVFEAGWKQGDDIAEIMSKNGFVNISKSKDLSGIERCIYGRKPI